MTASRRPNSPTTNSPTHYQLLPSPMPKQEEISDKNYYHDNLSSPPSPRYRRNQWRHYISYTSFAIGVILLMIIIRRNSISSGTISTIIDDEWLPLKASAINVHNNTTTSTRSERILNFAIVGFEKTGTTFLLKALGSHPEVVMPIKHSELSKKLCVKKDSGKVVLLDWLNEQHDKDVILRDSRELVSDTNKQLQHSILKHGMKCSDLLRKSLAIENLADLSDQTKLIIGLRHPVLWFQSLYNYRVRQSYEQNWTSSSIPSPHDLHGTRQWKGVSTTAAKFDIQLKQLAKVPMTKNEVLDMLSNELDSYELRISTNPLKVFIYTIEQLEDTNTKRRLQFEKDIQSFLNLQHSLKNFASETKENVNDSSYPESIDMCDSEYKRIRKKLIRQGTKSSLWIRDKFIKSKDVTVSDASYFESMLKTWSEDPCDFDGRRYPTRKRIR